MKHSFLPRFIALVMFALAGPCAVAADSMTKVYVNDSETGDAGRHVSLVWRDADSTLCLNVASSGTTIIFR